MSSIVSDHGLNYYHKKLLSKLKTDYDNDRKLLYRIPSTEYNVGDNRLLAKNYNAFYLKCTTAGTSSKDDLLVLPGYITIGSSLTDGTVTWTVKANDSSIDLSTYATKEDLSKIDLSSYANIADNKLTFPNGSKIWIEAGV